MKFSIAYQANGMQKSVVVEDENRWGKLIDYRIGQEFDGSVISDEWNGFTMRITGGMDKDGVGMKQGVFKNGRVKLLLGAAHSGFNCHRDGQRRRKSVRGCIIGRDLGTIFCVIVDKGGNEHAGLTDVNQPRRLGPKRANKIRKMYGLPRHWDLKGKKTDNQSKVDVDHFDVTRYVVKRPTKEVEGKAYYKAPNIQRLVTATRRRRKQSKRTQKINNVKQTQELFAAYIKQYGKK
eukprot:TRINITY_DN1920_c0_g1_i1.p2 TRINITY_DN1920_c0_g1~~TRINITY_DN1920_c0_g1_i1.p2  ORF type:complete len:235 (-),score=49.18 TRINITY_DN1920_c0_g1_i1:53-757(-)